METLLEDVALSGTAVADVVQQKNGSAVVDVVQLEHHVLKRVIPTKKDFVLSAEIPTTLLKTAPGDSRHRKDEQQIKLQKMAKAIRRGHRRNNTRDRMLS